MFEFKSTMLWNAYIRVSTWLLQVIPLPPASSLQLPALLPLQNMCLHMGSPAVGRPPPLLATAPACAMPADATPPMEHQARGTAWAHRRPTSQAVLFTELGREDLGPDSGSAAPKAAALGLDLAWCLSFAGRVGLGAVGPE